MSYDVRFAVETVKPNKHGERFAVVLVPEYDSPTYNLATMFRKSMGWDYEQGKWYPFDVFMPAIERGIHELTFNPEKYERYNPPNGWGTLEGALEALRNWYHELTDRWDGIQNTWDLKDIWMEW